MWVGSWAHDVVHTHVQGTYASYMLIFRIAHMHMHTCANSTCASEARAENQSRRPEARKWSFLNKILIGKE